MLDVDELKKAAEAATPDDWWADAEEFTEDGHYEEPRVFGRSKGEPYLLFTAAVGHNERDNSLYVALANPAVILELLAKLSAAEERVGVLEYSLSYSCEGEEDPEMAYNNCLAIGEAHIRERNEREKVGRS